MTSNSQFDAAIARHAAKPLFLDYRVTVLKDAPPIPEDTSKLSDVELADLLDGVINAEQEVRGVLFVDPAIDAVRVGAAFAGVSAVMSKMQSDEIAIEDKLATLDREVPQMKDALRSCLLSPSQIEWDRIAPAVDLDQMARFVGKIIRGLSGADPTQRASSSDGSSTTTASSTDGAPPAASTP